MKYGQAVTFEKTVNWYKKFYEEQMVLTLNDLQDYLEDAKTKGLTWTKKLNITNSKGKLWKQRKLYTPNLQ